VKKQLNPQTFVWDDEPAQKNSKSIPDKSSTTAAEAEMPLDAYHFRSFSFVTQRKNKKKCRYILDKFVSSSGTLLQEIIDGNASQQFRLFRLSPREHQLLRAAQGQSVLVSGRSGTGKTTCGLLRLATMAASFNKMFRAGSKCDREQETELNR